MTRKLLLSVLACAAAACAAGDFTLIRNGRPVCGFVPSGTAQVDADAAFFTNALARIAGAPAAQAETRLVFRVEERGLLEEDDWSVDFPDARTLRITGTDMSCRWALNEILEKDAGVVFCFYGPDGTHWPRRRDFALKAVPRTGGPKGLRLVRDMYVEEPEWERSLGGKKQRGTFFHHAINRIFPLEKYGKEPYVSALMPERNGRRSVPPGKYTGWQVCWASDLAVKEAVANICRRLDEHPEEKVYSLSVNDLEGYCECARCRASNGGTFETPCHYVEHFKSHSPSYYRWVNRVAAGVASRHPRAYAGVLAYCGVIDPPPFKLHPNVVPFICADSQTMVDPATAARRKELFSAWNACAAHFGVWDYTYGCDTYVLPRVYPKEMAAYYGVKRTCPNFDAAFLEGHSYRGEGPKRWLFGKLMYDPTIDVASALETWYVACVGAEAAPHLKAYYALWEDFWHRDDLRGVPWYKPGGVYFPLGDDHSYLHVLRPESAARADALMKRVVETAERTGDAGQCARARSLARWHAFRKARVTADGAFGLQRKDGTFGDAAAAAAFVRRFPEISAAEAERDRLIDVLADAKCAVPYKTVLYGSAEYAAKGFRLAARKSANLVKALSELLEWLDDQEVDAALRAMSVRNDLAPDLAAFARGLAMRQQMPNLLASGTAAEEESDLAAWRESHIARKPDSPLVEPCGRASDGSRRYRLTARGGWPAATRIVRGIEQGHDYYCSAVVSNGSARAVNVRLLVCTISLPQGSHADSGTWKIVRVPPGESRKVSVIYRGGTRPSAQMYVILNGIEKGACCEASSVEMRDLQASSSAEIVLESETFRLTLGADACAKSLVLKTTGEECLDARRNVPFLVSTQERPFNNEIKLAHPNRRTAYPANRVRREGDRLVFGFETAPYEAVVAVRKGKGYLAFTLEKFLTDTVDEHQYKDLSMDVPPVSEFRLVQLPIRERRNFGEWLNVMWDDKSAVAVVGTDPESDIGHERRSDGRLLCADLYAGTRLAGGSAAIVAAPGREAFLSAIDGLESDYDLPRGVRSRRNDLINAGILWSNEITPRNVDRQIDFVRRCGIRLVCLCFTSIVKDTTSSVGDYVWRDEYPRREADLRDMIAKFNAAGIRVGLHVLQTHIGLESAYVTPVADPRLRLTRHYTLAQDIPSAGAVDEIRVFENPKAAPRHPRCRVLKFGGELFTYEDVVTTPPYRFTGVKRGYRDTRAAAQAKGTVGGILDISEFGGVSCYLDQETDLQDEIAGKIARLYDCGMEFCYFDGSEGVSPPCGINVSRSQYRVAKRFRTMPVFAEGAAKSHFVWHLQSGGNAFDIFRPEEFKAKVVEYPLAEALEMAKDFTRVDFGVWWCIPPGTNTWRNGSTVGTQPDDWEFGTSKAAAWDCPAMIRVSEEALEKSPRINDLAEVLRRWEDVRARKWLTPEQKRILRDPKREYHLYLDEKGEYELVEWRQIHLSDVETARCLRAFLFERKGRRYVAYWHLTGRGRFVLADGAGTEIEAGNLAYYVTDASAAEAERAFARASAAAEPSPATVVCHRGERSDGAADNSYAAFSRAAARGFGFECDVRLDASGRVYCAHDAGVPAGRPTYFSEILPLARKGRWIVVDVKGGKCSFEQMAQAMKRELAAQQTANPENLFFICSDRRMLKAVRRILPEYKAMWLTGCALRGDFPKEAMTADEMIGYLKESDASGVALSDREEVFTKDFVGRLAAAGYEVHMCTQGRREMVEDAFRRGARTVIPLDRACEIVDEHRANCVK